MVTRWSIYVAISARHDVQETLAEIRDTMEELRRSNQTLEDNVLTL